MSTSYVDWMPPYFEQVCRSVFDDYLAGYGFKVSTTSESGSGRYCKNECYIEIYYLMETLPDYVPMISIGIVRRVAPMGSIRQGIDLWQVLPESRKERDYTRWTFSNAEQCYQSLLRIRDEVVDVYAKPLWESPNDLRAVVEKHVSERDARERAEQAARSLERARRAFWKKRYEDALRLYADIDDSLLSRTDLKCIEYARSRKEITLSNSEDRIWEVARGFQASRILLTGVELGIFGALGDDSKTSADVAASLATDPRATDRLMNALVALGFLTKENDLFRNSAESAEYLVPGKANYIGGGLMHTVNMWDSWSTMTESVRAGTAVLKREGEKRKAWVTPFIAAMHLHSSSNAAQIIPLIDLSGVRRVLDVGGGSGAYAMEFARRKPDVEAVVFDLPDVVPLTEGYIRQEGLSDRVRVTAGDFNTDELPQGFDLAFISAIIHMNSPEANIQLFRKCYRALRPDGRIVVQDFIVDESRTKPPHGAIFALNMLVATEAGDTYTESEVTDWVGAASFVNPKRIDPPGGTTLLIAQREAGDIT